MRKDDEVYKRFANNVYITRKARINTSERLDRTDFVCQLLINYYTLIILAFSIWTIDTKNSSTMFAYMLVFVSVLLFGCTLFVSSRNFKGRSSELKQTYIKLDQLFRDLEMLEEEPPTLEINKIEFQQLTKNYYELLDKVENHSEIDYYRALRGKRIWNQNIKLWVYNLKWVGVVILLVITPLLIPFFLIK